MGYLLGLCRPPDFHRGGIKPEDPELLNCSVAADDTLLPSCCRNTEGPPGGNSSDPIVTRLPHSFCGTGGVLCSFTRDYVVSLL